MPEILRGALVAHFQKNNRNTCQYFRHKKAGVTRLDIL